MLDLVNVFAVKSFIIAQYSLILYKSNTETTQNSLNSINKSNFVCHIHTF